MKSILILAFCLASAIALPEIQIKSNDADIAVANLRLNALATSAGPFAKIENNIRLVDWTAAIVKLEELRAFTEEKTLIAQTLAELDDGIYGYIASEAISITGKQAKNIYGKLGKQLTDEKLSVSEAEAYFQDLYQEYTDNYQYLLNLFHSNQEVGNLVIRAYLELQQLQYFSLELYNIIYQ